MKSLKMISSDGRKITKISKCREYFLKKYLFNQ